ncbi:hypothetical protein PN498_03695 [Oscillatoria sp. CS-180]|uniref:hypothetical protein n=1 Tax=Oscillatoria sp. CS-180 TaxID=3021720 RepID=UPI00232F2670|nr:hypothetical protein [Oscillatoria sp. CS-180]MDB9525078.1 hypothetical protein [Oscillatoria sp. CS-180]
MGQPNYFAATRQFLTAQTVSWLDPRLIFWYSLSLLLTGYYAWLVLQSAFSASYIVQDDARQHVFWMLRFVDPALFPNDFMADYFQSVAPAGYTALYRGAAALGIHPLFFNKILPPLLGLLTTHYCFRLSLLVLPLPAAAFGSTVLLNQTIWMKDDVVSGTPRAFVYVLLLAFLVYFAQRSLWPCLATLILQPLFYPHCALLSMGVLTLSLITLQSGRIQVCRDVKTLRLAGIGLVVLFGLLIPYAVVDSPFGPLVSAAEARTMPEFWPGGRTPYFNDNPLIFWLSDRPGILPTPILTPPTLAFGLLLPLFWKRDATFPWIAFVRANSGILRNLTIASLGLYALAHLFLFRLHLPSRFTHHSLRVIFALCASIVLLLLIDDCLRIAEAAAHSLRGKVQAACCVMMATLLVFVVLGYSETTSSFPTTVNKQGKLPDLYAYLRTTPKDTVIAGTTGEMSNLQVFAQRSPLISPELGLPYHQGYYQEFRQRTLDLIEAQYSQDVAIVQAFIQKYGVDYWLIESRDFVTDDLSHYSWFTQYQPEAETAIQHLKAEENPIVLRQGKQVCTVLRTSPDDADLSTTTSSELPPEYWLIDAECVRSLPSNTL